MVLNRNSVFVPSGTFSQTDTSGNSFSHSVSAFTIARYAVTYELWHTVRRWAESTARPIGVRYTFAPGQGGEGSQGAVDGDPTEAARYEPVVSVNWRTAMVWLNAYSEMSGLEPVYFVDSEYTDPYRNSNFPTPGQAVDNPYINWSANGYRFPTEGEWQFAASYQDGTVFTPADWASGATANTSDAVATGNVAWYRDNALANTDGSSSFKTWPVGQKAANQLGIYDISGNVSEWIWDWPEDYPAGDSAQSNYRIPENRDPSALIQPRGLRGGNFSLTLSDALGVGRRSSFNPWQSQPTIGFRYRSSLAGLPLRRRRRGGSQ